DRLEGGLPVFGEQAIAHLRSSGQGTRVSGLVRWVPVDAKLLQTPPALSAAAALEVAGRAFGAEPDAPGDVQELLFEDENGHYHRGYHVELKALTSAEPPRWVHYLVDGSTGDVVQQW